MWGPYLLERLINFWKMNYIELSDVRSAHDVDGGTWNIEVSIFLFLLGHTHNLLRSVLHAIFAQQIHSLTWQENTLDLYNGHR